MRKANKDRPKFVLLVPGHMSADLFRSLWREDVTLHFKLDAVLPGVLFMEHSLYTAMLPIPRCRSG
jgi:hypothetical protein